MNQQIEPITEKMKEERERERIIALRMYSLDCCLAIEAFEALYNSLQDAYEALPALQKVHHPWIMEDALGGDCAKDTDREKMEMGLREIVPALPKLILIVKGMHWAVRGIAMDVRREAMKGFDDDFTAEDEVHEWWLGAIRKDEHWIAAREQGVTRA